MEQLRNYLKTIINLLGLLKEAEVTTQASIPTKERIIEHHIVSPTANVYQIGTVLGAGTLKEIRMNVRGTTPSINAAIRSGTNRSGIAVALLAAKTITSETTDQVYTTPDFSSVGLTDRNQITAELSVITGTVDELYICAIYEND